MQLSMSRTLIILPAKLMLLNLSGFVSNPDNISVLEKFTSHKSAGYASIPCFWSSSSFCRRIISCSVNSIFLEERGGKYREKWLLVDGCWLLVVGWWLMVDGLKDVHSQFAYRPSSQSLVPLPVPLPVPVPSPLSLLVVFPAFAPHQKNY